MTWSLAIVGHRRPALVGRLIEVGGRMELGREQVEIGAELGELFDDDEISRRHACLEVIEGELRVRDLGSRNGTFVNEERVQEAALADGDVVRVGPVILVVARDLDPGFAGHAELLGASIAHRRMLERLGDLAPRPNTVAIVGEAGTGKRLVARALHDGRGRSGPLVVIACGALPDGALASELFGHRAGAFEGATGDRVGLLESADGGTVLLDGLDDASDELQTMLAELLDSGAVRRLGEAEARSVDVRILATSSRPLTALVEAGRLRQSFADRLGKVSLVVPPLRDRKLDIGVLARLFVERFAGDDIAVEPRLIAALLAHDWPGNVRELEGVIELAVIDSAGSELIEMSAEVARLVGADPSPGAPPNLEPTPAGVLVIGADGGWFEAPGKKAVDIGNRPTLRRLLGALAANHRDAPDRVMSVPQLFEIGWPGERALPSAGANRVYVALTTLRKLGLRDWIARDRTGYRITPHVRVVIRG